MLDAEEAGGSMHFLLFILIGLIAGALAGRVVSGHGHGLLGDIVVGAVGAFVGGRIFAMFLGAGGSGFFISLFMAFVGAVALLGLIRLIVPGRS
jgi:uncharacterized membrane protein YeaQ/YmgE (transglycosylase-associated protein family)